MIDNDNRLVNFGSVGKRNHHGYAIDGGCTYHTPTLLRDFHSDARQLRLLASYVEGALERYEQACQAADACFRAGLDAFKPYEIAGDDPVVADVIKARAHLEHMIRCLAARI